MDNYFCDCIMYCYNLHWYGRKNANNFSCLTASMHQFDLQALSLHDRLFHSRFLFVNLHLRIHILLYFSYVVVWRKGSLFQIIGGRPSENKLFEKNNVSPPCPHVCHRDLQGIPQGTLWEEKNGTSERLGTITFSKCRTGKCFEKKKEFFINLFTRLQNFKRYGILRTEHQQS